MGIEANFDMAGIRAYLQQCSDEVEKAVLENLNHLGMACVVKARTLDTYMDRTANLRNSIGYLVLKNGNIHSSFFEAQGRGQEFDPTQKAGEKVGEEFAKSLISEYTEGYALIVVAGMHYASYVEDVHGKDVLKPAKSYAERNRELIADRIIKTLTKNMR